MIVHIARMTQLAKKMWKDNIAAYKRRYMPQTPLRQIDLSAETERQRRFYEFWEAQAFRWITEPPAKKPDIPPYDPRTGF